MSHTITITGSPADPEWDRDDYEYTISGDCDQNCESWWTCTKTSHRHPSEEYGYQNDEWATKRVPELHRWIEHDWMVRDGGCGLRHAFGDGDPFESAAERGGYALVGVYDVEVDWDGDWWIARLEYAGPLPQGHDTRG